MRRSARTPRRRTPFTPGTAQFSAGVPRGLLTASTPSPRETRQTRRSRAPKEGRRHLSLSPAVVRSLAVPGVPSAATTPPPLAASPPGPLAPAAASSPSATSTPASAHPSPPLKSGGRRPLLLSLDYAAFRALPYYAQWDAAVAQVAAAGNRPNLLALLFHLVFFVLQLLAFQWVTSTTVPTGGGGALDLVAWSADWHATMFKNAVVFNFLWNYLGVSLLYNGPLYGEIGWRLVGRRFMTGIPIHRGALNAVLGSWMGGGVGEEQKPGPAPRGGLLPPTRQWYDTIHTLALVGLSCQLLSCGNDVHPRVVLAFAALCALGWSFLDLGAWMGAQGMQFHWPIMWLLQHYALEPTFGAGRWCNVLPGFQLWTIGVYVACAVAKVGPWWAIGFSNEWTTPPPFAGRRWLSNLYYRDARPREVEEGDAEEESEGEVDEESECESGEKGECGDGDEEDEDESEDGDVEGGSEDDDEEDGENEGGGTGDAAGGDTNHRADYRATTLASVAAHASVLVELGAPLLVLFGSSSIDVFFGRQLGFLLLVLMHLYV